MKMRKSVLQHSLLRFGKIPLAFDELPSMGQINTWVTSHAQLRILKLPNFDLTLCATHLHEVEAHP